jgi:hypothetical protein
MYRHLAGLVLHSGFAILTKTSRATQKTKTPGTQSLVPGVLFKSLALNIL